MSEIDLLHTPFSRYLREKGVEFIRARSDMASTIEKGMCDYVLLHPCFPAIFIEFKWGKGALTAAQKRVHARLIGKGHVVHVCRDIASAVEIVEAWQGGLTFKRPAGDAALTVAKVEERIHAGRVWINCSATGSEQGWTPIRKATPADAQLAKLL